MLPGINQKQIEKVMKQMGIKQENIDADEVIIKTSGKNIIIRKPSVARVNMHGSESFQISGEISEEFDDEDIKTIIEQAKCSRDRAVKALENSNGDLAEAILSLKG